MKRAVSISIGSSKRDKTVEIELLGESICLERVGTDGNMRQASHLYRKLDGMVDAFGVGGADLGLLVAGNWHPLYSILPMVQPVKKTPIVDGSGLKTTLEDQAAVFLNQQLGSYLDVVGRKVLLTSAVDRWGLAHGFAQAGFDCLYGDLLFTLGLPIPLKSEASVRRLATVLMPVAGRIPFQWIYPVGKEQEKNTPKWEKYFQWANVIAGDCHYIRRYMPDRLDGKIIVTNTTTLEDITAFRQAGVSHLITTTPVFDGRSFGTNLMEAALVAATGRKTPVDYRHLGSYLDELKYLIAHLGMKPQLQELCS